MAELLLDGIARTDAEVLSLAVVLLKEFGGNSGIEIASELEVRLGELKMKEVPERAKVDVLLLAVKKVEFRACLRAIGIPIGRAAVELSPNVEYWPQELGGVKYGVAMIGSDGNVESAIEVEKLLGEIEAKVFVLVGMAAGVRKAVNLGDVVVASHVIDYETAVLRPDRTIHRPKTYTPRLRSLQRIPTLAQVDPDWGTRVQKEMRAHLDPTELIPDKAPEVKVGVVLAGSKLVESDAALQELADALHGRTLAAEMEGAGFAHACLNEGINWFVVRGIADFAQKRRPKNYQFAATFAAAAFVRDAIASGRLGVKLG
jgi:nucleoside phosphorylase